MKQETIIVRPGSGEIKIFFNENLYDVTKGRVLVGGIDVRNYDMEVLRNQVSVVLSESEDASMSRSRNSFFI